MSIYIKLLFICLLFILIDIPYLYSFNKKWMDHVQLIQNKPMSVRIIPAIIVYAVLGMALYNLVLTRELNTEQTVIYSGILGLSTYGVFNFTNAAIFEDYDISLGVIDTVWGGVVTATVGYICKTWLI